MTNPQIILIKAELPAELEDQLLNGYLSEEEQELLVDMIQGNEMTEKLRDYLVGEGLSNEDRNEILEIKAAVDSSFSEINSAIEELGGLEEDGIPTDYREIEEFYIDRYLEYVDSLKELVDEFTKQYYLLLTKLHENNLLIKDLGHYGHGIYGDEYLTATSVKDAVRDLLQDEEQCEIFETPIITPEEEKKNTNELRKALIEKLQSLDVFYQEEKEDSQTDWRKTSQEIASIFIDFSKRNHQELSKQ